MILLLRLSIYATLLLKWAWAGCLDMTIRRSILGGSCLVKETIMAGGLESLGKGSDISPRCPHKLSCCRPSSTLILSTVC